MLVGEHRQYCNTDELIEKEGQLFFHPDRIWLTDLPEGAIAVDMEKHPEVFRREIQDGTISWDIGKMFAGKLVLPRFSYNPTTDTFTQVDTWKQEWGQHAVRRKAISDDLEIYGSIKAPTELKKIRKVLKVLIDVLPQVKYHPDVIEFMAMSDHIESHVQKYEKDTAKAKQFASWRNGEHRWSMHGQPKKLKGAEPNGQDTP